MLTDMPRQSIYLTIVLYAVVVLARAFFPLLRTRAALAG